MDGLIHADIFFFITGVAVIVFAAACAVLVVYLILISRDIKRIVKTVREQVEAIHGDIENVRSALHTNKWDFLQWLPFFNRNRREKSNKRKVAAKEQ